MFRRESGEQTFLQTFYHHSNVRLVFQHWMEALCLESPSSLAFEVQCLWKYCAIWRAPRLDTGKVKDEGSGSWMREEEKDITM